ncbi:MAG: serine/threonine protein kinase [Elusimicrobia bacterium]|nr:serine/threonine protein kinase [Elusimicrobiota bacterium]
MVILKSALILLALAWLAALPLPRAAQAQAPASIRGVSSAGALDGGLAKVYRENKNRQKKALKAFLSKSHIYIAGMLPVVGVIVFLRKRVKKKRRKAYEMQGLGTAIKAKIDELKTQKTEEVTGIDSVGAMSLKYVDIEGDLGVFTVDELPYIAKTMSDLEPLAQVVTSMSGADRLRLAKKLFELHEPKKSAGLLNVAAVNAAALVEGGHDAVVGIYDTADKLDQFIGWFSKGLAPQLYSAYSEALLKAKKYAQALKILQLSQTPLPADLPRLFELNIRLGNFQQAEALLDEVRRLKPVLTEQTGAKVAGAEQKPLPVEENQKFYYNLALLCEEKGRTGLADKIYQIFTSTGQQYRDIKERHEKLIARIAGKTAKPPLGGDKPADQPAVKKEWVDARVTAGRKYTEEKEKEKLKELAGEKTDIPAAAPALKKGWLDGKYELKGEIGAGGMGIVYEGWDHNLNRKVAVKKMRSELKAYPKERKRFLHEAEMVAHLSHPYIVGIHAVIEENSEVFLVFDYVEGKTLAGLIEERKQLPLKDCKSILGNVCLAVNYAHQQKILHRDLKPANIIVDTNNFAKVMDFGLASELGASLTRLTHQTIAGTPIYMAPEQYLGRARPETDIYALGVCLYEMLTGEAPFNVMDLQAAKERKDYKEVSLLLPWLPGKIDNIIAQALEPDPSARFSDAMKFYGALDSL